VVVTFLGSVLVGTDVVVDGVGAREADVVVVAAFFGVFAPLTGGTVVVVVVVDVAPGVVVLITCWA
jgi:hypothetical protein